MEPRGRQVPWLARTADIKFHQVREALRARPCSGLSAKKRMDSVTQAIRNPLEISVWTEFYKLLEPMRRDSVTIRPAT